MTKIEYKPHCARCGALIDEEVTYSDIVIKSQININCYFYNGIKTNPYRCPNCGDIFDGIEIKMPKKILGEVENGE